MVSTPDPCGSVRRVQQRIHLRTIQELHRPSYIALARHGQDSLAMKHVSRLVYGHEPKEGSDCGKTSIAAAGAVVALSFNMSEEVAHEGEVHILNLQFRRSL